MWAERVSLRRLWALLSGLPNDAAVFREDESAWRNEHEIAALTAETLDFWLSNLYRALISRWTGKRAPDYEPLRIAHQDRRGDDEEPTEVPKRGTVEGTKRLLQMVNK